MCKFTLPCAGKSTFGPRVPSKVPFGSLGLLWLVKGKGREPGNQNGQKALEAAGWRRRGVSATEAKLHLQEDGPVAVPREMRSSFSPTQDGGTVLSTFQNCLPSQQLWASQPTL